MTLATFFFAWNLEARRDKLFVSKRGLKKAFFL
jgi:hypothetical protein